MKRKESNQSNKIICLVMVERLFLAVPRGCLQFVIVVFLIILTYYFRKEKFVQKWLILSDLIIKQLLYA